MNEYYTYILVDYIILYYYYYYYYYTNKCKNF